MARILIDGRFIGVGESISRYVLEITKGILALDKENEYTLLVRPDGVKQVESLKLKVESSSSLKIKVLDIKHYSISEQTKLLKYLNEEKFDLVHFTQFNHPVRYKGKYVITIHDLTMIGHLHRNLIHKRLAFGLVMKSAVKDSTKIISISKTTRDDLLSYYKVSKDKFEVIYHGVDHNTFNMNVKSRVNEIRQFKEKYNISEEYILYTGMWKRHKNLKRILLAFEKFTIYNLQFTKELKIQLVLVGKIDRKEPEVLELIKKINSRLGVGSKEEGENIPHPTPNPLPIITTGFIDETELPIAYAGAFAYCIPSLSEGFGWPPLEAMASGTPVISSKESCMPEILGEAPLYFDAYNIDDIAEKMKIVTTDRKIRDNLIKKGLDQVKKYNWEECAEKTYKVYQNLIK